MPGAGGSASGLRVLLVAVGGDFGGALGEVVLEDDVVEVLFDVSFNDGYEVGDGLLGLALAEDALLRDGDGLALGVGLVLLGRDVRRVGFVVDVLVVLDGLLFEALVVAVGGDLDDFLGGGLGALGLGLLGRGLLLGGGLGFSFAFLGRGPPELLGRVLDEAVDLLEAGPPGGDDLGRDVFELFVVVGEVDDELPEEVDVLGEVAVVGLQRVQHEGADVLFDELGLLLGELLL